MVPLACDIEHFVYLPSHVDGNMFCHRLMQRDPTQYACGYEISYTLRPMLGHLMDTKQLSYSIIQISILQIHMMNF